MRTSYLRLLLRHGALMQTIASVVLVTFTWLLIHPTALAAKTLADRQAQAQRLDPSDEAELAKTLVQIEAKLTRLQDKLVKAEDTSLDATDLHKLHNHIKKLDKRARKNFARIEQHVKAKKLPAAILTRHTEMVNTYETEITTLLSNLDALDAAQDTEEREAMC